VEEKKKEMKAEGDIEQKNDKMKDMKGKRKK
jgi:hypothetical protein